MTIATMVMQLFIRVPLSSVMEKTIIAMGRLMKDSIPTVMATRYAKVIATITMQAFTPELRRFVMARTMIAMEPLTKI
jgi:hypothetical protein